MSFLTKETEDIDYTKTMTKSFENDNNAPTLMLSPASPSTSPSQFEQQTVKKKRKNRVRRKYQALWIPGLHKLFD